MTTQSTTEPTLTELTVNYSVGMKANIGNYESANANVSKTEKWNVAGLSLAEVEALFAERYQALQDELGTIIVGKYEAMLKGEI